MSRHKVPININKWTDVSKETKKKIWEVVKEMFSLPKEREKREMQQAGKAFREFKYNLNKAHVQPYLKKGIQPPKPLKYPWIGDQEWADFVAFRSTPEWEVNPHTFS
ncbi:hypothetical protein, partial [Pelagicoccus mobilis]|uniref:hypothetical protein n=1 Tax=Pelagicoccus mobilis TaxID=415221 RepID=UPI0035EAFE18